MLAATFADPWRFEANPEVYLLVAFLIGAYLYSVRVIGPAAVAEGQPVVTRGNVAAFVGAMVLLFTSSTWPIHHIGEEYLYSVHMVQHMMLTYFMPPLVLLATPQWLLRVLVGNARTYRAVRWLTRPVVAAVIFNLMVMVTHVPGVVNASTTNGALHYGLHLLLVTTAVLMWMPVVGPFPELQISPAGKMVYLFAQSIVPTVPAGWLVFAEGAVYKHYEQPVRVWGVSVTDDQQLAGAIMKLGGGIFLWAVVIFIFFKRFGVEREPALTYDAVTREFDRSEPPVEQIR